MFYNDEKDNEIPIPPGSEECGFSKALKRTPRISDETKFVKKKIEKRKKG